MKKNKNSREFILTGNIGAVVWSVSAPLMLNNLIQTVYNITDSLFIAQIDPLAVGAVSFLFPLIFINIAFCVAFTSAAMSLIAQYIGADRHADAKYTVHQLLILSLLVCVGIVSLSYAFGPSLSSLLGLKENMYDYGMTYYRIILIEVPFMFIMNIYSSVKQGQGDTVSPMIFTVISVGLNIILDPIFMFNLDMGIAGAAWATVLSRAIVCLPEVYSLLNAQSGIKIVPSEIKYRKEHMKKLVSIGIPSTLSETVTSFGFLFLNYFIIGFGNAVMTAFAVGNRILNIVTMPVMGVGSGLAIIVGQHLGAKDVPRAKKMISYCMISCSLLMLVGGAVMAQTAKYTVKIFSGDNEQILSYAVTYLKFVGYTSIFMAVYQNFIGVFQGAGLSKNMLAMSMLRLWVVRIPMIIILGRFTPLKELSIWISMGFSNLLIDIYGFILYKTGKWEKGRISQEETITLDMPE